MKVLELTSHYFPNVGGVETHLTDLVSLLNKRGNSVFVLTYQPLVAKVDWKFFNREGNVRVLRIPWLTGLFYKLVNYPILEFFYLFPGLFIVTPFVILFTSPNVIHAHGLVAGAVAVFWGKLFNKRVIIATHSIYNYPKKGFYRNFIRYVFERANTIMALSKQALLEILDLGVSKDKVKLFTYWIDLAKFKKIDNAKEKLGWKNKFIILFVGRLVIEKGVLELIAAAKLWKEKKTLAIAGNGPLEATVRSASKNNRNIKYLGALTQEQLPLYYSGADLVIMPSINQEGFGRVILESLACGTPVIGSNLGAIPEAMDNTVGRLITINPANIANAVADLYQNKKVLKNLAQNTRRFAEKKYSIKNAKPIIRSLSE